MENELNSPENQNPNPINTDFKEIINESKETIHAQTMVPPKKKPGRQPLPRDANGKIIRDGSSARVKASSGGTAPSVAPGMNSPSSPPPDISKNLIYPIKLASKHVANSVRVPEVEFDADETLQCAKALSDLYVVFAPQGVLSPKASAIANVFVTFGMISFTKYQIYLEKRPKPTPDAPGPEEIINPTQPFGHIPAEGFFRKDQ